MDKLFLLDAYALIYRAYYALIRVPRMTRDGFNSSAIFGFVNTLEELFRKENPSHMAVCFDPHGPTFRNEAYEKYKAERAPMPEDIRISIPIIKEIVKAYGIPVIEVEGYEADDVIGTLAKKAEKEGYTTYMMTPDKDFGQLVTPNILQYKPSYRGNGFELRGEEEVCRRYNVSNTLQIIDLLALMGDKVDNIPGCPGVGEKTAAALIAQFGSVDNMLANTDQIKGKLRNKIEDNAEQITFSKYLATICTDAPVEINPADLVRRAVDREKLFAIFAELEFRTLADRVRKRLDGIQTPDSSKSSASHSQSSAPSLFDNADFGDTEGQENRYSAHADVSVRDYRTVTDASALEDVNRMLASATQCGFVTIAEGENDAMSRWIGTAIALEGGKAFYIPTSYADGVALVLDIMARGDILKICANAKKDYVVASRRRTDSAQSLTGYYDIPLAHYVLQPEMRHSLDALAATYLKIETTPFPGKIKSGRGGSKVFGYDAIPLQTLSDWSCEQADITLRLYEPISQAVRDAGMQPLLDDIELPLVTVLAEMELTGVRIDTAALKVAEEEMVERIDNLEKEIFRLAGEQFNVGSPSKVGEILFDKLGLDSKAKKTKTGQYSTSEDILEKLVSRHPIVAKIIEYRALKKLLSTYVSALPAAINPETGRVHTNYNQTVTATGRISSSSPNLQNIPIRDDEGREIRRAFIAEPGCLFLSADYSQIELRLLADFSGDPIMLEAFRQGEDIHAITAARIYHKPLDQVTSNERRNAKTANFGIVYGISAFGLSSRLGIPRAEAKEIIDSYFTTFPTIRQYMKDSIAHAEEKGYVETRMGRRRMLPDINSRNATVRGYAERNAINAPLQGTAADIIKIAMIRIYEEMKQRGLKSKMIMQVHDELNFNVVEGELPIIQELVSRHMENAYHGKVVLTAGSGVATNWLDAH